MNTSVNAAPVGVDFALADDDGRHGKTTDIAASAVSGPRDNVAPEERATVGRELPALFDQWERQEVDGDAQDDPRDAEDSRRPDISDDEAELPVPGHQQEKSLEREIMNLAFQRKADREAEREQAFNERLVAVLTKPSGRDLSPIADVQDSCQPHVTVSDEASTLPGEIAAVMTPTAGSDDEGHCHETNDGATASPSTQVGTAAADNVTLKTAAGNDDAVEGDSHEVRATAMTLTEVGDVTPGVTAAVIGEVTPAASSTDASQTVPAAVDESMADEKRRGGYSLPVAS